jgi:hypothetical protein
MKSLTGLTHNTAIKLSYFLLTWERGEEAVGSMNLITTKSPQDVQKEFGTAVRNSELRIESLRDKQDISEYNKDQGWLNWDGEEIKPSRVNKLIKLEATMKTLTGLNTKATVLTKILLDVRKQVRGYFRVAGFRVNKSVKVETWIAAKKSLGGAFPGQDRALYSRKRDLSFEEGDAGILLMPTRTNLDYGSGWNQTIASNSAFFFDVKENSWGHISDSHYKALMSASLVTESKIEQILVRKEQDKNNLKQDAQAAMQEFMLDFHKPYFDKIKKNTKQITVSSEADWSGLHTLNFEVDSTLPSISIYLRTSHFNSKELAVEFSVSSNRITEATNFKMYKERLADMEYILSLIKGWSAEFEKLILTEKYLALKNWRSDKK